MTTLKFDSKLGAAASAALEEHIRPIYDKPGCSRLAIIEFRHIERTQPAPDADKDPSVKVRISHCEIPGRDQEGYIREAQRALYLQRTASGTLDDDGQLQLTQSTLKHIGGLLHEVEVARLRAGLRHWVDYAARVNSNASLTISEMHHELDTVAQGLAALLHNTPEGTS
ncbi:hypothetical protein FHS43_006209 [Streptosporangium becharense]|uniref:Uncharacterized protein n=1 Tax=Streptosporangium becharense TaxID=1816182 RepID=A0A7W9IGE7_9ACTN|nr:hypothetical protein [Streptosporangium becharense]MBB2914897.1 hypothetical protein [Streptosporangium becharense]MBB5820292.1 hypothetical protein [Streptosporangium becharense]